MELKKMQSRRLDKKQELYNYNEILSTEFL